MERDNSFIGERFGRLVVVRSIRSPYTKTKWECKCDCGNTAIVFRFSLLNGRTKSCGCFRKEAVGQQAKELFTKHGMSLSAENSAYRMAKYRCTNPRCKAWKDYGGRGVKFLFTSFEEFFAELGPRPHGMSLDRIDNNGNYEPGNVRWATSKEQVKNKRPNSGWRKKKLQQGTYAVA